MTNSRMGKSALFWAALSVASTPYGRHSAPARAKIGADKKDPSSPAISAAEEKRERRKARNLSNLAFTQRYANQ